MPSVSTSILGALTLFVLAGSPLIAEEKRPDPQLDAATVTANGEPRQTPEYAAQSAAAPARVPTARRGRWGGSVGIWTIGGVATWDYRNTPTPLATANGPFTGAVITIDHAWKGKYFSGGYRGPIHQGSRIGFGLEAQLSGAGEDLADVSVAGTSPSGAKVTFFTNQGGIVDLITVAGAGHVSYNVAPALSLLAGVRVSSLRVKPDWGAYATALRPDGRTFLTDGATAHYNLSAVTPFVGAELFLFNHGSLDVAANFLPVKTETLTDTPVSITFQRQRVSATAALRLFF